jgi:hypothetical protein
MISLVDIGAGLWPYAHNSKVEKYGGWWNDLVSGATNAVDGRFACGSVSNQRTTCACTV